jgi:iron(III) transport system ATP-binding protein
MWLEMRGVERRFGQTVAVSGLDLTLPQGAIGCLLGPSGCGKTTALRCVAGFEPVDAGEIYARKRLLSSRDITVPPATRNIGMVFQDYALFPHLTVLDNVGFGLHGQSRAARERRALDMLAIVGLEDCRARYPHEISGGQQQRVALARALAPQPDLVLLDEPFSNLDIDLRGRLSLEVREILKQVNATALLVTHDQNEAFAMADLVGVMQNGRLEQWDAPYELYHRPATRFVADFIGQGAFLPGEVVSAEAVSTELGALSGDVPREYAAGSRIDLLLRPDDVIYDEASPLTLEIVQIAFRGADFLYTLGLPSGATLLSLVPSHFNHRLGDRIGVRIELDHIVAFPRAR